LATLGAFTLIIHFNVAKITQTMKDNVMSMASSLFIHIRTLDRKMKRIKKKKNTSDTQ
jgi:hypothetical protein